jgi:flagellar export protein FliJ
MAFPFALQAVLHYRYSVEHQEELRLRAANQQVTRVRHILAQIDEQIAQSRVTRSRDLAAGVTSAELRFYSDAELMLQIERNQTQNQMSRLQGLRDQQQRVFEQARQQRQILESLQSQQFRAYQRERSRREQRQLDALILLRRPARNPGGSPRN